MKEIKIYEQALKEDGSFFKEHDLNGTLFRAYKNQKKTENKLIDFDDAIWDTDIEAITNTFKANGITEFTVSSTFSGMIKILAEFEKHGFKVSGLTEVKTPYTHYTTGKQETAPAIRMSL